MSGRHRRVSSRSTRGRHRKPPQRARVVVPVAGAVVVLGIGGVSAAAALSGGGGDHPAARPAAPAATATPVDTPAAVPPVSASSRAATAVTPAPVPHRTASAPDFAVTVVGRVSWVQVDGPHGQVLYLGMLRHGHTLTYAQRPLQVTLGDAGAVRLVLHHHAMAHAGRPGEVLHFTVR